MFADRWEYTFELKASSAFHFGTGEFEPLPNPERSNAPKGQFASIVRDHAGQPYLPPTTLKGALRALSERKGGGTAGKALDALFGTIKSRTGGGMGLLVVRGASASGCPDVAAMPYAGALGRAAGFLAARTAIDGASGTAGDHLLFHQEMAPAGVTFPIRLLLLDHGPESARARAELENVLSIVARDGLSMGKSQADGQGEFRVSGSIRVARLELTTDGALARRELEPVGTAKEAGDGSKPFRLRCRGPFLVVDSSRKGSGEDSIQVNYQADADGRALLLGSSLAGALRSRAEWLWELAALRGTAETGDGDPIAWLFGDTGRKAQLAIGGLRIAGGSKEQLTSLKIDRFSGAPIHGALFKTEAWSGVTLEFSLGLARRGRHASHKGGEQLFGLLCDDIRTGGLKLGHGANKGFGWFEPARGGQ